MITPNDIIAAASKRGWIGPDGYQMTWLARFWVAHETNKRTVYRVGEQDTTVREKWILYGHHDGPDELDCQPDPPTRLCDASTLEELLARSPHRSAEHEP